MSSRRNDIAIDAIMFAYRLRKVAYVCVVIALAPLGVIALAVASIVNCFTKEDS